MRTHTHSTTRGARGENPRCIRPAMHPAWRRCSSVAYPQYAPSSRLARRAPRRSRCNAGFHHGLLGGAATALLLAGAGTLLAGESAFTQSTTTCRNVDGIDKEVCVVRGRIGSDTTWGTGSYWVLRGAVFIEAPARLTIDAGTEIFGEFATSGTLIIARGAQILANGTAEAPIVFSSDQPIGERGRADWGGLIINGNAPINVPGSESVGEGDTGVYGGNDAADDSGHLRYVRVEFAGTEFSPDNELNGISFQGVGNRTEVDHVMVKYNKDDGLEFFGGTVTVKHVVLQAIADDSIDWTDGWTGKGQFIIVMQSGDDADQGIEADNNGDNNNLTPRSNPTLYNLTLIGDPDTTEGSESDIGMLLREGTSATIRNFIVLGFKEASVDIDHTATFDQVDSGSLTLGSGIIHGNCVVSGCDAQFRTDSDDEAASMTTQAFVTGSSNVSFVDPMLADPYNLSSPDYRPAATSPALNGAVAPSMPPNDGFFDTANFIGAVGPAGGGQDTWWQEWTDFATN